MNITNEQLRNIIAEELAAVMAEESSDPKEVELEEAAKKPCKPSKGKRFAKRVDGKCRSFGQKGKAKGGGDLIMIPSVAFSCYWYLLYRQQQAFLKKLEEMLDK